MNETRILEQIIFVGGPPRSGTTFVAKSINLHPGFVCAIDDHVYECWGLYYNRDRTGLVQDLRSRQINAEEAREILIKHLFADGQLIGAASSATALGHGGSGGNTGNLPVKRFLNDDFHYPFCEPEYSEEHNHRKKPLSIQRL